MNSYYYDSAGFSSVIESLQTQLDEYSKIVEKIMNLKDTIANSNEWVQDTIKSPFISKCDEYLLFYSIFITKLEAHVNYLKGKNSAMESLEDYYT